MVLFFCVQISTSRDMNETNCLLTPITVDVVGQKEPALFAGEFSINSTEEIEDTYLSFNGWGKGVAFINEFNIGRYWPVKLCPLLLYKAHPMYIISLTHDSFCSLLDHSATSMFLRRFLSLAKILWYVNRNMRFDLFPSEDRRMERVSIHTYSIYPLLN